MQNTLASLDPLPYFQIFSYKYITEEFVVNVSVFFFVH